MSEEDYTVRWFSEQDVENYISGLNKDLYDEYDENMFNWKWRENPNRLSFTSIAVVDHKKDGPVAFNSFLPVEIRYGSEVFKALQGCDGFVDEKHRRRGLFQKTLIFLEEEASKFDAEFLFGFNLVEAAEAARKAGSEFAYDVSKCFIKPENIRNSREKNVKLEPIKIEDLHQLYSIWASKSKLFHINRSLSYLKWRIERHPFKISQPYSVLRGEDLVGYIVTDKVTEGKKIKLTINDYNPGLIYKYLESIIENIKNMRKDITVIEIDAVQSEESQSLFRKLGFEIIPWYKVIMKPLHWIEQREGIVYRKGVKLSAMNNWHIAEGDIN